MAKSRSGSQLCLLLNLRALPHSGAHAARQVGGRELQGGERVRIDGYLKKNWKKMLQRRNSKKNIQIWIFFGFLKKWLSDGQQARRRKFLNTFPAAVYYFSKRKLPIFVSVKEQVIDSSSIANRCAACSTAAAVPCLGTQMHRRALIH